MNIKELLQELEREGFPLYFQEVDHLQLKQIQVHLGKESGVFYEGKLLVPY